MIRLRFSNAEIREVSEWMASGLEAPLELSSPPELRRWLNRIGPQHLPSLGRLWLAKARVDGARWNRSPKPVIRRLKELRREVRSGVPLVQGDLAFDGRMLIAMGLKPGPRFGEILSGLMDRVLEEPSLNDPDTLTELVPDLLDGRKG
jgi:tRNA nucleotidyltransferase (CCA-adding enzyme)